MSGLPDVSVVMSIYNGAETLAETLDSILAQQGLELELIAIDDGSTDDGSRILDDYAARDPRVVVIHQPNMGLTRALIAGCRAARAPLIARQDAGDRSRPGRLQKQRQLLESDPRTVLVTGHSQYIAPGGENLYVVIDPSGDEIRRSLLEDDVQSIRGLTAHGTAMFRRSAYFEAGEYRAQFRFAQDVDLWIRLAALGRIEVVPEILYEVHFEPRAISGVNRPEQIEFMRLAIALRDSAPGDAPALLDRAGSIARIRRVTTRHDEAKALYFIASCLRSARDSHWRKYAWSAIRLNPFHLRAWVRLLTSL